MTCLHLIIVITILLCSLKAWEWLSAWRRDKGFELEEFQRLSRHRVAVEMVQDYMRVNAAHLTSAMPAPTKAPVSVAVLECQAELSMPISRREQLRDLERMWRL